MSFQGECAKAIEAHIEDHGLVCPGWHREPHAVDADEFVLDRELGVLCRRCNADKALPRIERCDCLTCRTADGLQMIREGAELLTGAAADMRECRETAGRNLRFLTAEVARIAGLLRTHPVVRRQLLDALDVVRKGAE